MCAFWQSWRRFTCYHSMYPHACSSLSSTGRYILDTLEGVINMLASKLSASQTNSIAISQELVRIAGS